MWAGETWVGVHCACIHVCMMTTPLSTCLCSFLRLTWHCCTINLTNCAATLTCALLSSRACQLLRSLLSNVMYPRRCHAMPCGLAGTPTTTSTRLGICCFQGDGRIACEMTHHDDVCAAQKTPPCARGTRAVFGTGGRVGRAPAPALVGRRTPCGFMGVESYIIVSPLYPRATINPYLAVAHPLLLGVVCTSCRAGLKASCDCHMRVHETR